MFRKQLAAALAALLVGAACAPCARAQSGRRFPQSAVEREFIVLTADEPGAAKEVRPRRVEDKDKDKSFDARSLNAGSHAPVVYAQDGGGCKSTKCRVAVGALFTYLVFVAAVWAASDKP
jgi:hypothetical protein